MRSAQPARNWIVVSLAALVSCGCAGGTLQSPRWELNGAPLGAASVDDSLLCRSLADRFVGLPSVDRRWSNAQTPTAPAPSAGRWWVRQCSAKSRGSELEVVLSGPGWYWIDQRSSGIEVRQQVPFELTIEVTGRLREAANNGVFSLWFVPSQEPVVRVEAPPSLEAKPVNAWGEIVSFLPGVSPAEVAARRFKQDLEQAFQAQSRAGATFTYDLSSGQADATLGQLPPGKTPRPVLDDEATWLVNERLLLAPRGVQVLGPIDPGELTMNVIVEQGPGLIYRAVCQQTLRDNYQAIMAGSFSGLTRASWLAEGTLVGLGERTSRFRVEACKFYLVVTASSRAYAVGALRVRS
jgi:hypothetical protein